LENYQVLLNEFKVELALLKEDHREKVIEVFKSVHEDFYYKPASSTGKYHNREDNLRHGLVYHTHRVFHYMVSTIRAAENPLFKEYRSELLTAALLHDIAKYDGKSPHTKRNHDSLGADIALQYGLGETIATIIRFHSGKWSTDYSRFDGISNELKALCWALHICDMHASCSYNTMIIED